MFSNYFLPKAFLSMVLGSILVDIVCLCFYRYWYDLFILFTFIDMLWFTLNFFCSLFSIKAVVSIVFNCFYYFIFIDLFTLNSLVFPFTYFGSWRTFRLFLSYSFVLTFLRCILPILSFRISSSSFYFSSSCVKLWEICSEALDLAF